MYHILVCDDEKDIVTALGIYLKSDGYQVYEAYNGKEALEIIRKEEIHLVLMDIMMPEMDGLEATRIIRAMDRADAAEIPIFAMTANAFAEDIKESQEAGMNEHFAKPLDMREMVKTIYRYCRIKRCKKKKDNITSEGRETIL